MKNIIKLLRSQFTKFNIDGYIIPKNDEYFSEYSSEDRLKEISNFSGSAGYAVILDNKKYLFVDGRYTIQAKQQSGDHFNTKQIHKFLPKDILKNIRLGFDPNLFTNRSLNRNFGSSIGLISIENNLIDEIYQSKKQKRKIFYSLKNKFVGESHQSKINKICKILKKKKVDYLFISSPENVAWLMNIRGHDNPNSPIPNCRLLVKKNKKIYLISEEIVTSKIIRDKKFNKKQIINPKKFKNLIKKLNGSKFIIDSLSCSVFNEKIISSDFKIKEKEDPCYKLKSIKNSIEINNTVNAHIKDGLALTRFLYWIKNINKKKITEIDAKDKLEKFRKLSKDYLFPSFDTIAGAGPNGAIIHYRVSDKSNKCINKNDILLSFLVVFSSRDYLPLLILSHCLYLAILFHLTSPNFRRI